MTLALVGGGPFQSQQVPSLGSFQSMPLSPPRWPDKLQGWLGGHNLNSHSAPLCMSQATKHSCSQKATDRFIECSYTRRLIECSLGNYLNVSKNKPAPGHGKSSDGMVAKLGQLGPVLGLLLSILPHPDPSSGQLAASLSHVLARSSLSMSSLF